IVSAFDESVGTFDVDLSGDLLAEVGWILAVGVGPDLGGVGGATSLTTVVGALLTVVLVVSVLMLVACALGWAICSSLGNYQAAARSRTGLWVSLGTAALAGMS